MTGLSRRGWQKLVEDALARVMDVSADTLCRYCQNPIGAPPWTVYGFAGTPVPPSHALCPDCVADVVAGRVPADAPAELGLATGNMPDAFGTITVAADGSRTINLPRPVPPAHWPTVRRTPATGAA